MVTIRLHNSKTRAKEDFVPLDPANVRMYVCGPTVYDRAHLGNARPVVVFDVLYRLLRYVAKENGWGEVTYVRNFTDVDDKINARAAETGRDIRAITDETIEWYHADMDALGALRPTHEPRATEYIGAMMAMISALIDKGHAYEVAGHVLFDVRSFPEYGRLSGRSVGDMIAGARVEVAPYKRDALDFVLWKPSDASLPGWESPWGRGRPGWHIECSAMSYELLGAAFDIHGGGLDLQFPHHENEIAQSCCAYPDAGFARYWLHNEMVQVEGKKMSKSLGNFFTVRDLLEQGFPGEVIRYVMLQTHYRKPMDWTDEKARVAERSLRRWRELTRGIQPSTPAWEVVSALADDLNSAEVVNFLGHIGQVLRQKRAGIESGDSSQEEQMKFEALAAEFLASAQLVGLLHDDLGRWASQPDVDLSAYAQRLTSLREDAMQSKDFTALDGLKVALVAAGVEVRMSKAGVELVPGPDFDAAKLEALK